MMCASLVESCNKYIQKRFTDVAKSDEFQNLSKREVLEILSRDELYVTTEEQVRFYCVTSKIIFIICSLRYVSISNILAVFDILFKIILIKFIYE